MLGHLSESHSCEASATLRSPVSEVESLLLGLGLLSEALEHLIGMILQKSYLFVLQAGVFPEPAGVGLG